MLLRGTIVVSADFPTLATTSSICIGYPVKKINVASVVLDSYYSKLMRIKLLQVQNHVIGVNKQECKKIYQEDSQDVYSKFLRSPLGLE